VLSAVNAVDALFQEQDTTEALRLQVQGLLEETKRLRQELADARRELTRTKNTKKPSK
jgi:regulator of replication initiation timing